MCFQYVCQSCDQLKEYECSHASLAVGLGQKKSTCGCEGNCDEIDDDELVTCNVCQLVEGAIRRLEDLVVLYPWLATEGMAKLETLKPWEFGEDLVKNCREYRY